MQKCTYHSVRWNKNNGNSDNNKYTPYLSILAASVELALQSTLFYYTCTIIVGVIFVLLLFMIMSVKELKNSNLHSLFTNFMCKIFGYK